MERTTEKINTRILLIKQQNAQGHIFVTVCYDYVPVAKFNNNILSERKLAAVELVEQKICNKQIAGRICGFHRNTIANFLKIKDTLGIEALIKENRGLKNPIKYTDDIRQTIELLLSENDNYSDQQIARLASEKLGIDVSRSAVLRVRTANSSQSASDEELFSKDRLMELSKISETIDREKNNQLELNFEADISLKQKKEQLEQLEPLASSNKLEQDLINRLQAGIYTPFAGSLMHYLFLQEIHHTHFFNGLPTSKGDTYQNVDILMTLFFSIANAIKSIEALKLVNPGDFGSVLGMNRSPDKDVIRKKLHDLAKSNPGAELIDRFARVLLESRRIDDEVFFIDGHFLPYYGLHVIAKGYYTVRRLAMRGNELYVVSDLNGRPLFSITESNDIDFRPIISLAADKLIELGIKRPVLTFDRGGYGVHFFNELNEKADFVTWAKYLKQSQLARLSEASFTHCLALNNKKYLVAEQWRDVSESIQTAQKEGREHPTTINLRLVVIENIDTHKRIGIYTNNKNKSAADIAFYMLTAKYYKDRRDVKPVLRMIATRAGYLKLIGDSLIVVLNRIDLKKHRIPAEQLCHDLNKLNIVLNGRVKMKLYFHIAKF